MSTALVEVGNLVHSFTELCLQVSSTCSIRLSCPLDFPAWKITRGIDLVTAGGLWIARGNDLKIFLHIKIDGIGMDEFELRDLIEDMGSFLKNAEMWSQLYLQPSLSNPSCKIDDTDSSATLILSLKHGPQPFWNSKSATKARTLIVSDTRPPADIPCAGLEEVRIDLIFLRTSQIVRKRIKHKISDYPGKTSGNDILFEDNDLCSAEFRPLINIDLTGKTPNSYFTVTPRTSAKKRKRKSSSSISTPNRQALDITAAVKIVDAILRSFIYDTKIRLSPGVERKEISPGPKLAEISPALFSPGYLHAVCQRNRFLPRISHSIASIHRRAKSAVLGSKIDTLLSSPLNCEPEAELNGIPFLTMSPQTLTVALQTRLWNLIQHRLFDRQAARKLKPLQTPAADQHRASDEMLDNEEPETAFQMPDEPSLSSDQEEMLGRGLHDEDDKEEMLFSEDEDEGMGHGSNEDDDDDELLDNPETGPV
ncbi:MAG: hypothetical protein Q9187_000419 [Circinaria calcarea]